MHRPGTPPNPVTDQGEFNAYMKRVATSLGNHNPQRARALEEIENHLIDATAEHMRRGVSRFQAETLAIEELGPPETVGAAFAAEDSPIEKRTGVVRWLPMALPIGLLAITIVAALTIVISSRGGWTVGDGVALRASLLLAVIAAVVALGSFLAIQRADQDRNWRWVAWAGSGAVIAYFVLR